MASNNQNDIVNALQNLIDKSVKANTAFLEESGKIVTGLLSKKLNSNDLKELNNAVLNDAVKNFINMNIRHTENLMDFGVNVSKSIVSFIDKVNSAGSKTTSSSIKNNNTIAQPRSRLQFSVKQGEQLTSAFNLNSNNAFTQSGKFYYEDFIDAAGKKNSLTLLLSPKEFVLEPAQTLKIELTIAAPSTVAAGTYTTTVRLDGMDNQEFDIVVDVIQNDVSIKSSSPVKKTAKADAKKTATATKKK